MKTQKIDERDESKEMLKFSRNFPSITLGESKDSHYTRDSLYREIRFINGVHQSRDHGGAVLNREVPLKSHESAQILT